MKKVSLTTLVLAACQTISTPLTESEPATQNTCTFTTINGIALPSGKHYDPAGREIVFEDLDWGWYLAESGYYENGQPVVIYSAAGMQKHSKEFQSFVFHHEIGHFKLGHLRLDLPVRGTILLQREKEANCYAIDYFENVLKCSPEQMKSIYEESLPYWPSEVPGFKECLGK